MFQLWESELDVRSCRWKAQLHLELQELIPRLEQPTGARFSPERLAQIMALSNEQAEWNRRTRDLLASAPQCPVPVNDVIPAVIPHLWGYAAWATASEKARSAGSRAGCR